MTFNSVGAAAKTTHAPPALSFENSSIIVAIQHDKGHSGIDVYHCVGGMLIHGYLEAAAWLA